MSVTEGLQEQVRQKSIRKVISVDPTMGFLEISSSYVVLSFCTMLNLLVIYCNVSNILG